MSHAPDLSPAQAAKQAFRQEAHHLRNALPVTYRRAASLDVCRRLEQELSHYDARRVAGYFPIGSELDVLPTLRALHEMEARVAFPVVEPFFEIRFYAVDSFDELEPRGKFHIPEPHPERAEPVDPDTLDAIVVPGLAWDIDGYRIGYGKGCYDRLLRGVSHEVVRIGVGFDELVHRKLPLEQIDLPVDVLLTPQFRLQRERSVWETHAPEQTVEVGWQLGESLAAGGGTLALVGELGAGKTHLVRGIAGRLGIEEAVDSPSYTLAARYGDRLSHVDLYRLDPDALDEGDVFDLDDERESMHCTVVEWADRAWERIPLDAGVVTIRRGQDEARIIEYVHYDGAPHT